MGRDIFASTVNALPILICVVRCNVGVEILNPTLRTTRIMQGRRSDIRSKSLHV